MTPASDRSPTALSEVVSATIPGRRSSDVIEVVALRRGSLGIALLDVRAARGQDEFQTRLRNTVRVGLELSLPLNDIARSLRNAVSLAVAGSVGVTILRMSEVDERVELLNAGMPPVACIFPDGRLLALPSLSTDVGPRSLSAHPYEMMPWVPGSVWVLASDGATAGSLEDAALLWAGLGLPDAAAELAQSSNDSLAVRLSAELRSLPPSEDASVVVALAHSRVRVSGAAPK